MSGLGLVPNQIVGYRIKPDWHSFNVVLVKKKGVSSKDAGQEYGEVVAYCRNLQFAAQYIVQHASRVYGEELQKEAQEKHGAVASAEALAEAITKAENAAMAAVSELAARIDALEISRRELVQSLGDPNEQASAESIDDALDEPAAAPFQPTESAATIKTSKGKAIRSNS